MNDRSPPLFPLLAAIGLGLLAAILGLVSVGSLHGSLEDIAQTRLQRVQLAGRLESARLQLANRQQTLVAARSAADVEAAREGLTAARAEMVSAVDALAEIEDAAGRQRVQTFRDSAQSYFAVLDRLVPLVEGGRTSRPPRWPSARATIYSISIAPPWGPYGTGRAKHHRPFTSRARR